eukprot:scaffold48764_cov68-Phaeocystis_antarctica.AAC.2
MDHEHKERSRGGLQCDLGHPPERGGVFDRNIREGNMAASPYPLTGARTRTWAPKPYAEDTTIRPTTQQRLRSSDPAVFLARPLWRNIARGFRPRGSNDGDCDSSTEHGRPFPCTKAKGA